MEAPLDNSSIRVVIETAEHRIDGELTLPKEGYRSRLSDYLNQDRLDFVALTNATVEDRATGETYDRDFLVVGTRHILLGHPE